MIKARGNTITKVVIVLVFTLGALGTISYYSYKNYSEFSEAVDKLYSPVDESNLTEEILSNVSELESRSRAYSLTLSEENLEAYLTKVEDLREKIELLYQRSAGTEYHGEADTLRRLFRQKTESFESLIKLKISQSERQEDRVALKALAKTQSVINGDSLLPTREVTTTVIEAPEEEEEEDDDNRNFFQRLFGRSGDKDEDEDTLSTKVKKERVVAYDSAYLERVDTLITSVEEALLKAENQRRRHSNLVEREELKMVANDQRIIDQLRSIIFEIKRLENEQADREKQQTVAITRESFSSVLTFALCGGALAIVLFYLVIRDIGINKRMQLELSTAKNKAERLAKVKEEFLANMSHEIRTPLNAIIGFSEQLFHSDLDEEQRAKLNNVRSSSEHLLMLVNDILDYSKIESGKLRLEEIGFKASSVVNESLATLEHLADQKNIELRREIDPDLEGLILKGDPLRLKQILINLAGNGVKFTDSGYVKISADIIDQQEGSVQVRLMVEDTGKGIPPAKMAGIFEEFSQEDSSINRRYGGTGLGLSISKSLVELQHGTIEAKSEPGQGSVFAVVLPYKLTDKESYSGKFDPDQVDIDLRGRSLLMIDDDRLNHVLLKPALERWGVEFESAYNGEDGIAKTEEKEYDFILVDLQMPVMGGIEVIKVIRSSSAGANPQIVLCTANALVRQAESEFMEQVDALLLKPFKEYELAALLADLSPPEVEAGHYSLENFNAFAGEDEELLRQFILSFIETNKQHLQLLDRYFEEGDYENVGEIAHKMKNTFGQLQAREVMGQLIELEKLVHSNQAKRVVRERIAKTHQLAEKLFAALEQHSKRLRSADPHTLSP